MHFLTWKNVTNCWFVECVVYRMEKPNKAFWHFGGDD
jgi:hypothetical protein